ncbi:ABC transporter permease [Acidisoma silvae]|uniref:ABC transporter permease n=1 Tax=Acidisoma silvae TaxID=2802396 RepID=A0A963YUZ4_9PROT|nr:ABC transporter permease [Acidisoma silvae]MCB8877551.1 ABC transporter permease [Acidisoma silvae]
MANAAYGARTAGPLAWMTGSGLAAMLLRRLLLGLLTLLLVSLVVFAATQLLPGDVATAILGRTATPARIAALRAALHLNHAPLAQYGLWILGLLHGDLGNSLVTGKPILSDIAGRLYNSSLLVIITAVISLPIAVIAGLAAAVRHDRATDIALSTVALALSALPEFVIGIALIIVSSLAAPHVLPMVSLVQPGHSPLQTPRVLVLPLLTLTLVVFPYVFRMMRGSMIDVLESDYIEMARLKGVSPHRLLIVHALPSALPPTIQAIALTLAYLAGGIVVVEYVFGYAGIGEGIVSAVGTRDLPEIQDFTLILAAVYVCLNIIADVCTVLLTPKLRTRRA